MGTRADFYIGRGPTAVWIGSIAYDGYPSTKEHGGVPWKIRAARSKRDFRREVGRFVAGRDDGTRPKDGWPWPWEDSQTTDYAYAFDEGRVWATCFGGKWWRADRPQPDLEDDDAKVAAFPNMKARQNVALGPRSGFLLLHFPPRAR